MQRNAEAQAEFQKALAIDPQVASVHRAYGDLLFAMGQMDASEQEYLTAIKLGPSADTWAALARSYLKRDRTLAAVDAMEEEAKFAPRPYLIWQDLGYLYLQLHQPENAARVLDKAERNTPSALLAADNGFFEIQGCPGTGRGVRGVRQSGSRRRLPGEGGEPPAESARSMATLGADVFKRRPRRRRAESTGTRRAVSRASHEVRLVQLYLVFLHI